MWEMPAAAQATLLAATSAFLLAWHMHRGDLLPDRRKGSALAPARAPSSVLPELHDLQKSALTWWAQEVPRFVASLYKIAMQEICREYRH